MPGITLYSIDENGNTVEREEFTNPTQKEINEQDTPFLRQCWDLYSKYKLFGLPNGKSYLKERNSVIQIIEICEREVNKYHSWSFKKDLKDR